jgi:3-methyladenine DNA glycosylase AlkD
MRYAEIIKRLKSLAKPENLAGMARYGINIEHALGIPIYVLRPLAREIGMNHKLAIQLWGSGIHDARLLASMLDDPALVSETQMESWAKDFNSWDICDQVCCNLFDRTTFAYKKVAEWSSRTEEFVKRAAFAIIAGLAAHDKEAPDSKFIAFFPYIKTGATDERNYVKKAVNWALRNIGKRNLALNRKAIALAKKIKSMDSPSARWIASDALRELTSEKINKRLKKK